jgi:predicted NBD/HSP70 family sugar kinase
MKRARQVKIKQSVIAQREADLVRRVRIRGGASRGQLARDLALAPSTVSIHVDRLIAEGLLCEGPRVASEIGRPATLLTLDPNGGRFVGVDIEGRNAMVTLVDFSQQPIEQAHLRLRKGETADSVLNRVLDLVESLVARSRRPLLGVGVGVPGAVDVGRGVGIHYEHIKGWLDVEVSRIFQERLRVPVFLENNIRSMALAEMWFGAARGISDFICLGVRSGIGAGIVSGGSLQHGHDNMAGEIGSWPCPSAPNSEGTAPGETVTFQPIEAIASLSGLARQLNERLGTEDEWNADQVVEGAQRGDPVVADCLQMAAEACGWVAGQLDLALNVELVVLAGPLTALGDRFLQPLEQALRRALPPLHSTMPRLECSRLGPYAGALGAAAISVHNWQPTR